MVRLPRFISIVNPKSGGGLGTAVYNRLLELCSRHEGQVYDISTPGLRRILQQDHNAELLIVAGGDGSVSWVIEQSLGLNFKLALVPLGTGNDFAREFGISSLSTIDDLEARLSALLSFAPIKVAIPQIEVTQAGIPLYLPFCCYASFGFDAEVVKTFSKWRADDSKALLQLGAFGRRAAYALAGLSAWTTTTGLGIEVSSIPEQIHYTSSASTRSIIFSNIKSYMGLGRSNTHSNPSDQLMECTVAESPVDYIRMFTHGGAHFLGSAGAWELKDPKRCLTLQVDGECRANIFAVHYGFSWAGEIELLAPRQTA